MKKLFRILFTISLAAPIFGVDSLAAKYGKDTANSSGEQNPVPSVRAGENIGLRASGLPIGERNPVVFHLDYPFRMLNGIVWDLRPLATEPSGRLPAHIKTNWVRIETFAVKQIVDDGALVGSVFIKNFPRRSNIVDGSYVGAIVAHPIGAYQYKGVDGALHTVNGYDFGVPCDPPKPPAPVIVQKTPEQIADASAKLLKFQQDEAAKGMPTAQYDLGIRYLTGSGVESNRITAIKWLSKSAAQGNSQARKKLEEIGR